MKYLTAVHIESPTCWLIGRPNLLVSKTHSHEFHRDQRVATSICFVFSLASQIENLVNIRSKPGLSHKPLKLLQRGIFIRMKMSLPLHSNDYYC